MATAHPTDHPTSLANSAKSLGMVKSKKWGPRVARLLGFLFLVLVLTLWQVPWQQTIIGNGEVFIYDAMSRPQNVEAQIPGRIAKWFVNEGEVVQAGEKIAEIEDIESRFLAPDQVERFQRQIEQLKNARDAEQERLDRIDSQIAQAQSSQNQRIKNASESYEQTLERRKGANEILRAARQNLKIAERVAKLSADERLAQVKDAVRQAEQVVVAAKQRLELDKIQRGRIKELYEKGLESKRADEIAANDLVASETTVERANLALEIARRQTNIGVLTVEQVRIEIERAKAFVDQALAAVGVADRDVNTARNNIEDIRANTQERVDSFEAIRRAGEAVVARLESDLESRGIELSQLTQRRSQQFITSPASGRIVRLLKVGAGATVKSGDVLATVVPESKDRAVELMVSDNDVSFVKVGRKVRLQFAGYPALQFAGVPEVTFGTFGGVVAFIDPVDNGKSQFRVIIKEDQHELLYGRKDDPWPKSAVLRPGAEAVGWIMLDRVSLGFELWRQFNGFPPNFVSNTDPRLAGKDSKSSPLSDKDDKDDKMKGDIKIRSKK